MSIEDRVRSLDTTVFARVESQTTPDDRKSLLALHAAIADTLGTFNYLEIGSHLGGSLQGFVADPRCTAITSIDPRPPSQPDHRGGVYFYLDNSTSRMIGLLSEVPGADLSKLTTIEASTPDVDPMSIERPDLCLIDGEHTIEAALNDARFCVRVSRGHGILVFHDRSVVELAIRAFLAELGQSHRAYPLITEFFVVELGEASLLAHPLIRARLERPRAAWLAANRAGVPRFLVNDRTRRLPSYGDRVRRRARLSVSALMRPGAANGNAYDDAFYEAQRAGSARSAAAVVPIVQDLVGAASVVDVGCGVGTWLLEFAAAGVEDLVGVDGEHARAASLGTHDFVAADLSAPLRLDRRFDMALCLEVGEHLPRDRAPGLVDDLTRLAPVVLFSAAIPFQGGTSHVAESWADWWGDLFRRHGYVRRDVLRHLLWEHDEVEPWYAQNAFVYVDEPALDDHPRLRDAAESGYPARAVHPDLFCTRVEMLESMLHSAGRSRVRTRAHLAASTLMARAKAR